MKKVEKVSILMAIYKPNITWLQEQLESLNNQTYKNLELIVYNDCPQDKTNYEEIYLKYITNFKFTILQGKHNLGSTLAFGKLTEIADSDYIAYCDQDDVWLPDKVEILVSEIKHKNADLICSDMYVIDANSNIVADSITKVRPRYIFYDGDKKFKQSLIHNWVTGCTVLIKTNIAKRALPFPKEFVHDAWLATYVGAYGKIVNFNKPLIKYRIHGNNQTTVLVGINSKEDYYKDRIKGFKEKLEIVEKRFLNVELKNDIRELSDFINVRFRYYLKTNIFNFYNLLKFKKFNRSTVYFELCLPFMPEFIFRFLVKQIRKGNI